MQNDKFSFKVVPKYCFEGSVASDRQDSDRISEVGFRQKLLSEIGFRQKYLEKVSDRKDLDRKLSAGK